MRIKGIIFLAVLAGIFILLSIFLTDFWLEKRLESVGTSIVGAKVEIDHLDFSIAGLHVKWDSLQVTNPKNTWENILSTGQCEFDMDFLPLLSRKVIVENFQATNLRSGMKRTTDGKIEKKMKIKPKSGKPSFITRTVQSLENEVKTAPAFSLGQFSRKVNVDSIKAFLEIRSPERIDSLKNSLSLMYGKWDEAFSDFKPAKELETIRQEITSIEPASIQSVPDLQNALITIDQSKKQIDSLRAAITTTRASIGQDFSFASRNLLSMDDWIKEDYRRALDKAKLPDINQQNIGKFLFGSKVVSKYTYALNIVGKSRSFANRFKSDKPKKQKPPRLKGQDIWFTKRNTLPSLWIKRIEISGKTLQSIAFSGLVTDVSSQQLLVGKPTRIDIQSSRKGTSFDFAGELNYLGKEPQERFRLALAGLPLSDVRLSDSPMLPNTLKSGSLRLESSLDMQGDRLESTVHVISDRLVFDFAAQQEKQDQITRIVQNALKSIDNLDLKAIVRSDSAGTDFSLNSNLDDILVKQLKSQVSAEIEAAKAKLLAEVDSRVQKHRAEVENMVREKQTELETTMKKYEDQLNEQIRYVDNKKKEVETRIEEEKNKQKKKLEDEAKKKLKGIIG
jgi:uncharacterized protein (TIGR03545 family)